ncbi:MAG: glycosyltransferase family 2 protein [Rhodomicrobium sp.]
MQRPVCTVIIPALSCLKDPAVALASAAMQHAGEIEVIVLEGRSADRTGWLKECSREWPALRTIETGGCGPGRARNAGIEAARAPLIAFLDAACWWWPDKLARQVAYHAAHPETAFSFTDYLLVSADGESQGSCFDYWQPPLRRGKTGYLRLNGALQILLAMNLAGTSTVVASKAALEKIGGFRDLASAEDWDLWLRLAAEAPAAYSKAITATYPVQPENVASRYGVRIAAMEEIIAPYESSPAPSIRRAAAKARASLNLARAELARPAGRHAPAALHRSRSFPGRPSARPGKATAASLFSAALYFLNAYGAGK